MGVGFEGLLDHPDHHGLCVESEGYDPGDDELPHVDIYIYYKLFKAKSDTMSWMNDFSGFKVINPTKISPIVYQTVSIYYHLHLKKEMPQMIHTMMKMARMTSRMTPPIFSCSYITLYALASRPPSRYGMIHHSCSLPSALTHLIVTPAQAPCPYSSARSSQYSSSSTSAS